MIHALLFFFNINVMDKLLSEIIYITMTIIIEILDNIEHILSVCPSPLFKFSLIIVNCTQGHTEKELQDVGGKDSSVACGFSF